MSQYHHGVTVQEVNQGIRVIRTVSSSVIGIVGTAPDADAQQFPLNVPTLITNISTALDKIGGTGTLRTSFDAINDQCSPMLVVVRVDASDDDATQTANIIGGTENGVNTGLQALLVAKNSLNVTPRILSVPGLDNQAVATELAVIAEKLKAFAYVSAHDCETMEDAVAYRGNFGSREMMVIYPNFVAYDLASGEHVEVAAPAYAVGLRAKLDTEQGWHKTISNVAVGGVTGISKSVYWDLLNAHTDANYLNSNEVTTLTNAKGFRFWGSRTCSSDPLFAFENYTRTAQILKDTIGDAHLWAVDKPITKFLIHDIVDGINTKFRQMVSDGYILGAEAYVSDDNEAASVKNGQLRIEYDYTPVPPLENLHLKQKITDSYIIELFN